MGIDIHINIQRYAKRNMPKRDIHKRSYDALLEYEENCILKYDVKEGSIAQIYSKVPKRGERMVDYANKHNTTIYLMKSQSMQVEKALLIKGYSRFQVIGLERK